jgi:class 3 adenylate cyclase
VEAPPGTVTFLFTDIEGSTRRSEQRPEWMTIALALHDGIVRRAIAQADESVRGAVGSVVHFRSALEQTEIDVMSSRIRDTAREKRA